MTFITYVYRDADGNWHRKFGRMVIKKGETIDDNTPYYEVHESAVVPANISGGDMEPLDVTEEQKG